MNQTFLKFLFGSQHEKDIKLLLPALQRIDELEKWARSIPGPEYPQVTKELKKRRAGGESLDSLLPEAFALVREAARRTLGERPFASQILGAIVLHQGKVMEMKTGEGKTLSCVAAAYLNALSEKGVHIVTVNDYLAERDATWMSPVFEYLGVSVGAILSQMDNEVRREAYTKDITYGTNNEFGFDYLRENMRWNTGQRVQPAHHYCIIDEIDSILIDEARTPLIISGTAEDDTTKFNEVNRLVSTLKECEKDPETGDYPEDPVGDYKVDEKSKKISFTDEGLNSVEKLLLDRKMISGSIFLDDNFEYIHYFTQALKAHRLFKKDVDYVVQDNKVEIVDEFTGRILHGRRYSEGLHQAIEAKEGIRVAKRNRTLATITFQNFFRMYDKISGMTGTADTEAREFSKIYNLEVVVIPTNRPLIRDDKDDVIYLNEQFKTDAICDEIERAHKRGQPVLVGTVSIEKSETLSARLVKKGIRHEVLNAKNHAREAIIISEAGAIAAVTIATNMAGRGTDIKLGGNPEFRARRKAGTNAAEEEFRRAYAAEYAKWAGDYEAVKKAGGLYVLGTERHDSRRIDNQLRGRSGRQGDPGLSKFFISLDDNLMRLFSDNLKPMMQRLGMKDGEPIFHPWINKSIERAQSRVEDRNFEIRKHLLDYDNVLNEQREFIYSQRDEILKDEHLLDRVMTAVEEIVTDLMDAYSASKEPAATAANDLLDGLQTSFFYAPEIENIEDVPLKELENTILSDIKGNLKQKEAMVGLENLNSYIRYEYLRAIDSRWQEHLENLEALREAVYLRAYSQKNPLLEYKLEGFSIFDKLIVDIKSSVARKIVTVKIQKAPEEPHRRRASMGQASHVELGQFAGGAAGAAAGVPEGMPGVAAGTAAGTAAGARRGGSAVATAPRQSEPSAQVKRSYPKVGRNDPCPCGSGRKYKHCHGK